jgi:glycosyltransferase involved in cell wall biosynthesis
MKKLSIVIPFLNEGNEPAYTIQSIYDTCDASQVEIIAIDDHSDCNFTNLTKFPEIKVVRNPSRIGSGASKQKGADLAQTPNLFIIDGHMRFKKNNWLERLLGAIEKEPETIFCTTCVKLEAGQMEMSKATVKYYGANLVLVNTANPNPSIAEQIIEPKWAAEKPYDEYDIPCVLGANYAVSAAWFKKIRGMEGLQKWGAEEAFMSLKSWMAGGKCKIIKDIEIGHMFRSAAPYATSIHHMYYNKMLICYTILPTELSNKLLLHFPDTVEKQVAFHYIREDWKKIREMKVYYDGIFKRSIYDICSQLQIPMPA